MLIVYDDKIFQSYIKSFYENEIIIQLKKLNMEIPKNYYVVYGVMLLRAKRN